jgi:glycosyltransferase involved in cell wall biosynthesis
VSETFIEDHVRALRRYRPLLVGFSRACPGLALDGIETRVLNPLPSRFDRLNTAFAPWRGKIDDLLADVQPLLVHAHFVVNALAILPFVRRRRLPLVVTAHGHDVAARNRSMRPIDRLLYTARLAELGTYADKIICVSQTIRDLAIERGLPAAKCKVMHLGIPLERFADARKTALPQEGRLLFVGRLVEKKGLPFLLDALARLRSDGIRVDLQVVGDGPERASLQAKSRALGISASFLGAQPRSRVVEELRKAWAFAMPSIRASDGDSEGLPIVLLEAQAAGVPIIAFDNGPAREAVLNGRTGILSAERDIDLLARSIGRLMANRRLREQMSLRARDHVWRHFDLRQRTTVLEDLYDDVVEGDGPITQQSSPGISLLRLRASL